MMIPLIKCRNVFMALLMVIIMKKGLKFNMTIILGKDALLAPFSSRE